MVGISISIGSIAVVSIAGLSIGISISRPLAIVVSIRVSIVSMVGISISIGSIAVVSIAGLSIGISISRPLSIVVTVVSIRMVSIAVVTKSIAIAGISFRL